MAGTPSPTWVQEALPGFSSATFDREGLVGNLPILVLDFPTAPQGIETEAAPQPQPPASLWEMTVVPVANNTGREQPIFIRFVAANASALKGAVAPRTLYFDTFAYIPSWCAGYLAGCVVAERYYSAMLDSYFFWEDTWTDEGIMQLSLPSQPLGTDGELLHNQARHALVLDMITRSDGVWPRYGTSPGYDQPGVGSDGFQEIFTSTMTAALEWGLFGYARDVLDNWLEYFVRHKGSVLYRGPEMAQTARMLTVIAQYFTYTGDDSPLLKHFPKIAGISALLRERVADATRRWSPGDSRHGIPTGNDEADLVWNTLQREKTELPYISIAAETWRGLRDCGTVLTRIARTSGRADLANEAKLMLAVAGPLRTNIEESLRLDGGAGSWPRCRPYVAGTKTCGMLNASVAGSNRASEPWRTYSEAMYSGLLGNISGVIPEILEWHQTQQGEGVRGSRLKLGVLAGCGGDVSCGDSLEAFTIHGWGYGLLQADMVESFLLQFYALSAHAYTRGTFIAPESTPIDRTKSSPSFATPAGLTVPLLLKWMLIWEDPVAHSLWFGRAIPRVWFAPGVRLSIDAAPTAYGKIGLSITSTGSSPDIVTAVEVSLRVPSRWADGGAPNNGIVLRLRLPSGRRIAAVTVGGSAFDSVDADREEIMFSKGWLEGRGATQMLKVIVVAVR